MKKCTVKKCKNPIETRGYCHKHYNRFWAIGVIKPLKKKSVQERFYSFFIINEDCWKWVGSKNNRGYGMFWNGKKHMLAHRWSFEFFKNPISGGNEIDHICRNRDCVNPNHIEEVTRAENCKRQGLAITHCPQGHEYTKENTYTYQNMRQCKICRRIRNRMQYWK